MIRVLLAICLGGLLPLASTADDFDWRKTLEAPLSPGTVAILLERADEPEVQERWRAALKDPNPDVRAAGARAVESTGLAVLVPAVKDALGIEEDFAAAQEEIRALVVLGSPADDGAVIAAARRIKGVRPFAWLRLGDVRRADALAHLAAAREMDGDEDSRIWLVRSVVLGGGASLDAAADAALRQQDPVAWYAVWEEVTKGGSLADGYLIRSVSETHPRVRAITYWHVALLVANGGHLSAEWIRALDSGVEARLDPKAVPEDATLREARFAFELLKRARKGKPREDLDWARGVPRGRGATLFPGPLWPAATLLTSGERRALSDKKHLPADIADRKARHWPEPRLPPSKESSRLAIWQFPRAYVSGIADVAGCRETPLSADIAYAPNGRPRTLTVLDEESLTEGCARTARILFLSGARRSSPSSAAESEAARATIGFLDAKSLAWDVKREGPITTEKKVEEPRKIKDVGPVYPPEAKMAGVEGNVTLEATIATDGRVVDIKVVSGNPYLTQAAVDAVRQWVYTPTLVDGQAVPVTMMVTVGFRRP